MNYYDFQKETLTCPSCGWEGQGSECTPGELYRYSVEMCCPSCEETLGCPGFLSSEETLNHPDAPEDDRRAAAIRLARQDAFERSKLKDPFQLPDLEGDHLHLVWDTDDYQRPSEVIIRHGSVVVWREMVLYEGYRRFEEVGRILKTRYGSRLKDMIPSPNSELYLYGDALGSPNRIKSFRKEIIWPATSRPNQT